MIAGILNTLSLLIIIYDTLGYLVNYADKTGEKTKTDYSRLIYTWVFYTSLKYLACCTGCTSTEFFLGNILSIVFAVVRLLVVLPVTGIRALLTTKVIEDGILNKAFASIKCCVEKATGTPEPKKE